MRYPGVRLVGFIGLLLVIGWLTPCLAEVGCSGFSLSEMFRQGITDHEVWWNESKEALLKTDPEDWSEDAVNEYLDLSLKLIYFASNIEYIETGSYIGVGDDVTGMLSLTEWPGNPLNNWEPIQIRDLSEGFNPGDIAMEVCPSSYATRGVCRSFEYYIYGRDAELPSPDATDPNPSERNGNSRWANPPLGAISALGIVHLTDDELSSE